MTPFKVSADRVVESFQESFLYLDLLVVLLGIALPLRLLLKTLRYFESKFCGTLGLLLRLIVVVLFKVD